MWIKQKKNMLFFQPNFHFFFENKCGFVNRKISDEKVKKNEVQKKCPFCARSFWRLLDIQYYCGMLFRYKCWCPESLGYVRPLYTCHGRPLFQKVPKILPENAKKSVMGHTSQGKMLLRVGSTKLFFIGNKFYMHKLHSATRISYYRRRNNFWPK